LCVLRIFADAVLWRTSRSAHSFQRSLTPYVLKSIRLCPITSVAQSIRTNWLLITMSQRTSLNSCVAVLSWRLSALAVLDTQCATHTRSFWLVVIYSTTAGTTARRAQSSRPEVIQLRKPTSCASFLKLHLICGMLTHKR
jgi:hypothetical protein